MRTLKLIEESQEKLNGESSPNSVQTKGTTSHNRSDRFTLVRECLSEAISARQTLLIYLGYLGADSILQGQPFIAEFCPTTKPKARFFNPERGKGVVNGKDIDWKDWIDFAKLHGVQTNELASILGIGSGRHMPSASSNLITLQEESKREPVYEDVKSSKPSFPDLKIQEWDDGAKRLAQMFLLKKGWNPNNVDRLINAGIRFSKFKFGKRWENAIAVPVFGESLEKGTPVNWMVMPASVLKWPLSKGPKSTLTMKREHGAHAGIAIPQNAFELLRSKDLCSLTACKTEGCSDYLALLLRDDRSDDVIPWTNPFGCDKQNATHRDDPWIFRLFQGVNSIVIHDCDEPGQRSAIGDPSAEDDKRYGWCQRLVQHGSPARNLIVPNPDEVKGYDLNDYFAQGGTTNELLDMACILPVIEFPTETIQEVERDEADPERDDPKPVSVEPIDLDRQDESDQPSTERQKGGWSLSELIENFPERHEEIIEGVCRRGEVVNIIGSPKQGKSWFLYLLAFCLCSGRDWLGRKVHKSRVLVFDNEIHRTELAFRLQTVADALGIPVADVSDNLTIDPLRGNLVCLIKLCSILNDEYDEQNYDVIFLDAFYRFIPDDVDENSTSQMTSLYNTLDAIAQKQNATIILNHHTSKGDQSSKNVTDVGAGAGAMTRACDSHLILRPHEQDGCAVLEAVCRSNPSPEPTTIKFDFPLWRPVAIEPKLKRQPSPSELRQAKSDAETEDKVLEVLAGKNDWMSVSSIRRNTVYGQQRIERSLCRLLEKKLVSRKDVENPKKNGEEIPMYRNIFVDGVERISDEPTR
ncbi:AAA family ATPase [Roseiconus lacunae]|uniref:AAA family ATPase n=1 Tax=Roseiconus lacunae TaxID=2605694 RepID=UPI001E4A4074|nr:AAA family ATPase [Roseiconus lacunae]MCD0459974.1 helicase RepA family protein [Roseiconus lacunae]